MTEFIDSFATQQFLPPWVSPGSKFWGFAIRLGEDKVCDYLNKYFNGGYPDQAPYLYSPLPDPHGASPAPQFGLLAVGAHKGAASLYPGDEEEFGSEDTGWDRLDFNEVYFVIPVLRHDITAGNILANPRIVWVQPVVYCDNASMVFSAREIWGADMQYANIDLEPDLPDGQLHADAAIIGIKEFNPRSFNELLAILHLKTGRESPIDLKAIVAADPDLGRFVEILGNSGMFAGQAQPSTSQTEGAGGIEMNELKQFRAVEDMGDAIYRAIVATRVLHANIDNIRFLDCAQVEIDFMWSDSIAEMLRTIFGIDHPGRSGPAPGHPPVDPPRPSVPGATPTEVDWDLHRVPLTPALAFAFTSDVRFKVLKTLYAYGAGVEATARRRTSALKS